MINITEAIWVECTGEAHSNPYIDNCMSCIPFWHYFPTCPNCKEEARGVEYPRMLTDKGYCKGCRNHYSLSNRP